MLEQRVAELDSIMTDSKKAFVVIGLYQMIDRVLNSFKITMRIEGVDRGRLVRGLLSDGFALGSEVFEINRHLIGDVFQRAADNHLRLILRRAGNLLINPPLTGVTFKDWREKYPNALRGQVSSIPDGILIQVSGGVGKITGFAEHTMDSVIQSKRTQAADIINMQEFLFRPDNAQLFIEALHKHCGRMLPSEIHFADPEQFKTLYVLPSNRFLHHSIATGRNVEQLNLPLSSDEIVAVTRMLVCDYFGLSMDKVK